MEVANSKKVQFVGGWVPSIRALKDALKDVEIIDNGFNSKFEKKIKLIIFGFIIMTVNYNYNNEVPYQK